MNPSSSRSIRSLVAILGPAERAMAGGAAFVQALERLAVVGAAVSVTTSGPRDAWVVAGGLGVVFLARAGLVAALRIRIRGLVLQTLAASLLAETADVATPPSDELEYSLTDGLYASEETLGQRLPELAGDLVACVILTCAIVVLVPTRLVLEGGAAMAVGALVAAFARRLTSASSERSWAALVPALHDLSTAIQARLEIISNGDAGPFLERLAVKLRDWRVQAVAAGRVSFLAGRAPMVGTAVAVGLILLAEDGVGKAALAQAAVLVSATPAFAGVARGTMELARTLVRARPTIECIARGRDARPQAGLPPVLAGAITWRGVSFRYPDAPRPTLTHVDLVWNEGELLGLAGSNGSGKSTFLRLLLALQQPTTGVVAIGETSLVAMDRVAFRRSIGYLAQRPFLPDRMTVLQGVRLLSPDATPAAIQAMLTRLALWPVLLRRSPDAPLDVKVGALSAGEKQRVAIARVLLRDARLLLLDEPDANLDAAGVALVAEVLREESRTRRVLFAAHDPHLLASAGKLLSFDGGTISAAPTTATARPEGGVT